LATIASYFWMPLDNEKYLSDYYMLLG